MAVTSTKSTSTVSQWNLISSDAARQAAEKAASSKTTSTPAKTTSTPAKTTTIPTKTTTTVKPTTATTSSPSYTASNSATGALGASWSSDLAREAAAKQAATNTTSNSSSSTSTSKTTTTATKTTSSSPTTSSSSTSSATPAYIVSSSAKEAAAKASSSSSSGASSSSSSAGSSATGAMGASYSSDMAREAAAREAAAQATAAQSKAAQAYEASKKMITPAPKTNAVVVGSAYTVQDRGDIGMNAKGQIYALPVKTPQTPSSSAATKTSTKTTSQTTVQLAAQAAAMATENMINAASKKLTDQNRNNAQLQAAAMSTETMINDAARKVSAQQSKLVSQQSNISDAFTRSTVAERMIQEVTDRQVGTQKALVAKTETAIQTQMQAKSSGVDLDMLKQMSSVGYKSLHGEAAADLFKANFYIRNMDEPSLSSFSMLNPEHFDIPKGTKTTKDFAKITLDAYALDEKYLLASGARSALESRIAKLQAGYSNIAWTMESLFTPDALPGSLTSAQCVDKMIEVMHEYDALTTSPQTKGNTKPLGGDALLDGLFHLNVSSNGNMTASLGDLHMQKQRQDALFASATVVGVAATNAYTNDPAAFRGNPDAGVGKVTSQDYAAGGFKTGNTQATNGGVVEGIDNIPKPGSLSNVETRRWYLDQEAQIPNIIDKTKPLEQQAKQAFEYRNQIRTQARDAMADKVLAEGLFGTKPNMTWEEIIEKYTGRGFSGEMMYQKIIEASQRSNSAVNEALNVLPE